MLFAPQSTFSHRIPELRHFSSRPQRERAVLFAQTATRGCWLLPGNATRSHEHQGRSALPAPEVGPHAPCSEETLTQRKTRSPDAKGTGMQGHLQVPPPSLPPGTAEGPSCQDPPRPHRSGSRPGGGGGDAARRLPLPRGAPDSAAGRREPPRSGRSPPGRSELAHKAPGVSAVGPITASPFADTGHLTLPESAPQWRSVSDSL